MTGFQESRCLWARPLVLLIIACSIALAPLALPVAHAQSAQQSALARTLFEEGVALADAHDFAGAADRFGRAYSLKPTAGVAFNWASVLVADGKLIQAQELLRKAVQEAGADSQLREQSEALLSTISARLAHLRVHVEDSQDARLTVFVDGSDWPRAAWDVASPIDPGTHAVVLKRVDLEAARSDVTLADGESRDIDLRVAPPVAQIEAPTAVPIAPVPTQAPIDEPAHRPLYKSWKLWTVVGAVVVAGAVTGAVLGTRHDSKQASPIAGNATPGVLTW